ncbi:hypothetical protein LPW11_07855 [Geomonas sp. RF6]|uniref:hypothetical protein n=1 Tax=Geomonas sp. RF6 TaxID=2897342 RepID=UPI001E5E5C86|nr:hypothetical protein [Geomonas sp. RF6]UFS72884.1 hypothetical protein LPW11_07855 [Geomonas sp. RF6]
MEEIQTAQRPKIREAADMAKVNYKFQKRQKELERQKKKEEKQLRKQETSDLSGADAAEMEVSAEEPVP